MKPLRLLASTVARLKPRLPETCLIMATLALTAGTTAGQTSVSSGDGWVVLPVGEYTALKRAASPVEPDPLPPPVEATLSRIDYNLKVDGDLATGEARLTVDVVKDGWVRLAMPEGLMIREAQLDGRQVTLVPRPRDKGHGTDLLLAKAGRSILTLKIVAPVSTVAGTDILQLPVNNSAVSRATVELMRQGVEVRITGGLLLEQADTSGGTRLVANGQGQQSLTFAWRRRVDDQRSAQALRLRGSVTELVGLGEDMTQINAEIQLQVTQGQAQEIKVLLPTQLNINQVSGATVADWNVIANELIVTFIEPVQSTTRFTLSGELRLPRDGKLEVPLIRLPAAERETGGIAVEVLGAGEIKERQSTGLEEADAAELGQLISSRQSPSLVAFRLKPAEGKSTRDLSINVARYTPQAVLTANVEEAEYKALLTPDGKMLVQSRFAVRNNQRNFLKVNLPTTAVLWSASVAGRPIRPGRAPDGSLLLPLEKVRTGNDGSTFVVEVSYLDRTTAWSDKGRIRLSLVAVDLPISKSQLLLHHSPIFRLTPAAGTTATFRVATYQPPTETVLRSYTDSTKLSENRAVESARPEDVDDATQKLVSRLRDSKSASTPARNRPLRVAFPHLGPAIFLIAELTSENQTPSVELEFQRGRK